MEDISEILSLANYLLDKVLEKNRRVYRTKTNIDEEVQKHILHELDKGATQREVAEKVGWSRATVQAVKEIHGKRQRGYKRAKISRKFIGERKDGRLVKEL